MKKKIITLVLGIALVASNSAGAGSLTANVGEYGYYEECYCGPGSEEHFHQVNRSYIGGSTRGSGDLRVYSNENAHTSHHVTVGNVRSDFKSYTGEGNFWTGEIRVNSNTKVREDHSYSKY